MHGTAKLLIENRLPFKHRIDTEKRLRVLGCVVRPQQPKDWLSTDIVLLIRHQPARTVSARVSRFARMPVCEQCAGKVEGNSVGTRSGRSPLVLPLPDRALSQGVRIERRSRTRNAVQRRTCAAFRKQWRKSLITDSGGPQCPGTYFSGHRQTVGSANRLRKALNRHNFIPGPWRVCEDSSRHVCEKTRARLLQSSRFHHRCRLISWEN